MDYVIFTAEKIKKIKIQGAKAIAVASLFSLKKASAGFKGSPRAYLLKIKKDIKILSFARPTEPLTVNCLKYVLRQLSFNDHKDLQGLRAVLNSAADYLLKTIDLGEQKIISTGERLIKKGNNVLTHCHSSTVENILKQAYQRGRFKVFNTETRPLFQGRVMAKNLRQAGVDITMVEDSAATFLLSDFLGKDLTMDLVIIGADAIMPDGSAVNKIGSFGISLAAHDEKIPIYVAAHLLKMDDDGVIPIEIRSSDEIWPNKPKGLKIINFAFDKIPAKNITGFICEFGLIKPKNLKNLVKKYYPWIFK